MAGLPRKLLTVQSNIVAEAEFEITGVDNTVSRTVVPLRSNLKAGVVKAIVLAITAKAGAQPSAVDIEILDTDNLSATLNSVNTIYRNTGITVTAAVPELLLNQLIDSRFFVTKGTTDAIQIVLTHTGGDGTTNYTYNFQIYGDA